MYTLLYTLGGVWERYTWVVYGRYTLGGIYLGVHTPTTPSWVHLSRTPATALLATEVPQNQAYRAKGRGCRTDSW